MTQQGDVDLFQTTDGGDITIENGLAAMSSGYGTTVYLSLFGGNEFDLGGDDTSLAWWGNDTGGEAPERQYRSETGYMLKAIPATTGNLIRIKDAIKRDLDWMITGGYSVSVSVAVTMPALNTVHIIIELDLGVIEFTEEWAA